MKREDFKRVDGYKEAIDYIIKSDTCLGLACSDCPFDRGNAGNTDKYCPLLTDVEGNLTPSELAKQFKQIFLDKKNIKDSYVY